MRNIACQGLSRSAEKLVANLNPAFTKYDHSNYYYFFVS